MLGSNGTLPRFYKAWPVIPHSALRCSWGFDVFLLRYHGPLLAGAVFFGLFLSLCGVPGLYIFALDWICSSLVDCVPVGFREGGGLQKPGI